MPKGPLSFGDGLQRIISDLAQMELDPTADRGLIAEIRETIISFQQQSGAVQTQGLPPDAGPGAIPGTLDVGAAPMDMGMPLPVPTVDAEMSRGPRPGVDTGGAVEELSRILAGS